MSTKKPVKMSLAALDGIAAILGVSKGAARADLLAVYRRSARRLGSYSPGSPSALSAVWWPA